MNRSQTALSLRRREYGALKIANRWSAADEIAHPYWLRNVRIYQDVMAKAASERSALLGQYLTERQAR